MEVKTKVGLRKMVFEADLIKPSWTICYQLCRNFEAT